MTYLDLLPKRSRGALSRRRHYRIVLLSILVMLIVAFDTIVLFSYDVSLRNIIYLRRTEIHISPIDLEVERLTGEMRRISRILEEDLSAGKVLSEFAFVAPESIALIEMEVNLSEGTVVLAGEAGSTDAVEEFRETINSLGSYRIEEISLENLTVNGNIGFKMISTITSEI